MAMRRSNTSPNLAVDSSQRSKAAIKANYGTMRSRLLKLAPISYHCRLFCGGSRCKYCNPDVMNQNQQDIPGLYSTWVTEEILATSRPTTSSMTKFDIIRTFRNQQIKSLINLQRSGEHGECGPPLDKCGFSYDPEEFMKNDIFHYNFGWPDFGVASLSTLLDMVKVMHFAMKQGKVAIHCHAGLGRTGVLICSFLIWARDYNDKQAVEYVRAKRPGSVQTVEQVQLVERFSELLQSLKPVFRSDLTFEEYLQKQRLLLHGSEGRVLKFVPKIVFVICERILELFGVVGDETLAEKLDNFASGKEMVTIDRRLTNSSIETVVDPLRQKSMAKTFSSDFLKDYITNTPLKKLSKLPPLFKANNGTSLVEKSLSNDLPILQNIDSKKPVTVNQKSNSKNVDFKAFLIKIKIADLKTLKAAHIHKESLNTGNFLTRWKALIDEEDSVVLFLLLMDWFQSLKTSIVKESELESGENKHAIKTCRRTMWHVARMLQTVCDQDSSNIQEGSRLMAEMFCRTDTNESVNSFMKFCISNVDDLLGLQVKS